MKGIILDKHIANHLPLHDADFVKFSFVQSDNGEIDLSLHIVLYEGEFEDLEEYKSVIKSSGDTCLLMKDCTDINIVSHNGVAQRDSIDFVNIGELQEGEMLRYRIETSMISGMKILCTTKQVYLTNIDS